MYNTTDLDREQAKVLKRITILRSKNAKIIENIRENVKDDPVLERVADNMSQCGTYISFATTSDGRHHINAANFCRERLCLICSWRRQAKFIATTYPVLEHLVQAGYTMLFVTLTCKSCRPEELQETVEKTIKAYTALMRLKLMRGVQGAVRTLEVTYNAATGQLHPHIHAIMIMEREYSPLSRDYIPQPALANAWQAVNHMDYSPVVDIRLLKSKRKRKAYVEVMKYTLKPAKLPPETLQAVYYALKGKRLISFSGILATLRRQLSDDVLVDNIVGNEQIIAETMYKLNTTGGIYEIVWRSIKNEQ